MIKIYDFFQRNKWLLWTILLITFGLGIGFGVQCRLEEDIFKLLPQSKDSTSSIVFTNIRLKDKVMLQAVRKDGISADSVDNETLALAMDYFVENVMEKDSNTHYLQDALYQIDPMLILDAGMYLMQHGPAYLDFTDEEMDSLVSEAHIRQQIQLYEQILETETGQYLFDVIAYDPCGISMKNLSLDMLTNVNSSESNFQFNHLFSGKGQACIGFFTPNFGVNDSKTASKLIRYFEDVQETMQTTFPGVEILYHGTIVQAAYNSIQIRKDIVKTLGIALAVIFLLLGICLKRPSYLLLLLLPIAYGAFTALAGIYLIRGWMSLMALGLGVIVLGVALSYCLHVMVHYIYTADVKLTIREQSKPVFLGALTTIGAFAGLLLTKSSLLQDFGAFALLTIVGTTFISLFIMPHCFPKKNTPNKKAFAILEKLNSYEIDRNDLICLLVVIWVVVCICFSGRYTFDNNLRHIGYISESTQKATDNWNANQNEGKTQQYFAAMGDDLNDALEQLPAIEQLTDSLYREGLISKPAKMSAVMPSISMQEARIDHWQRYFTPEKQKEVWRNVTNACLKEGIEPDMFAPFQEAMAAPASPDLVAEAGILPDEVLNNFTEQVDDRVLVYFSLKTDAEKMTEIKNALTANDLSIVLDPYYYSTNLVEIVRNDFNKIMLISSVFVLLLLLITYRNVWIALIAFLPMCLSWYTVLGAMALFHQPFNLINIVVSSFIFGIGVDYSIFIMDGLLRGRQSKTMVYHKTAITISAFILVMCMFSLLFAVHPAIHSIGFASVTGMITTLLLSYTLQPRCYRAYLRIHQYGLKGFIRHYTIKFNHHKK